MRTLENLPIETTPQYEIARIWDGKVSFMTFKKKLLIRLMKNLEIVNAIIIQMYIVPLRQVTQPEGSMKYCARMAKVATPKNRDVPVRRLMC